MERYPVFMVQKNIVKMSILPKAVYIPSIPVWWPQHGLRADEATEVMVEVGSAWHFEELLHLRAKSLLCFIFRHHELHGIPR